MIHALYRRPRSFDDLVFSLPGTALDFPAIDAEAERRWGRGLIRIASWLTR